MIDSSTGFTITRELDATPDEIWQAWTDPAEMVHWFHPRGVIVRPGSVSVDARVGGSYAYTMVNEANGDEYPTVGVYRELVPAEKLVFTWGGPDDDPDDQPLVTVTIEPLGELTRMTFDLRGAEGAPGDEYIYDGWDQALDSLTEHLGQTPVFG